VNRPAAGLKAGVGDGDRLRRARHRAVCHAGGISNRVDRGRGVDRERSVVQRAHGLTRRAAVGGVADARSWGRAGYDHNLAGSVRAGRVAGGAAVGGVAGRCAGASRVQ